MTTRHVKTRRQGDTKTKRQRDKETRSQRDKETRRQGDKATKRHETRRQGGHSAREAIRAGRLTRRHAPSFDREMTAARCEPRAGKELRGSALRNKSLRPPASSSRSGERPLRAVLLARDTAATGAPRRRRPGTAKKPWQARQAAYCPQVHAQLRRASLRCR